MDEGVARVIMKWHASARCNVRVHASTRQAKLRAGDDAPKPDSAERGHDAAAHKQAQAPTLPAPAGRPPTSCGGCCRTSARGPLAAPRRGPLAAPLASIGAPPASPQRALPHSSVTPGACGVFRVREGAEGERRAARQGPAGLVTILAQQPRPPPAPRRGDGGRRVCAGAGPSVISLAAAALGRARGPAPPSYTQRGPAQVETEQCVAGGPGGAASLKAGLRRGRGANTRACARSGKGPG
jgi:hypothetical protein